jgi:membrane-bound metal-dependent hydrolase YbcI (DUF457 family)
MNPITHFLISSNIAALWNIEKRDAILVTAGGIIADLDGVGGIIDLAASRTEVFSHSVLYERYHHILCHNITFCAFCLIFVLFIARRKLLTAALFTVTFHIHLLCDIAGSGGSDGYNWPIPYLYPFSMSPQLEWSGQWELTSWQNNVITIFSMIFAIYLARKKGNSFISWMSNRADIAFIKTIRQRFPLK